ncbi:hypothetical protein JCM33374_g5925 [Metschnikowia sp. JCM 33374]|nr:hypothetical protein JCM33374_g5925 [Metschnikowia sp. JCM 33374]
MMNQLENIAELSELLGPASINLFAMGFWQALAHTYVILGSRKRSKLSKDIAKWLIEKWNTTSEKLSVNQLEEVSTSIPQILMWLGGYDEPSSSRCFTSFSGDPIYKAMKDCGELQKFIVLEEERSQEHPRGSLGSIKLEYSPIVIESVISSICKNAQSENIDENLEHALSLSMMYAKVSELIRPNFMEYSTIFEEKSRDLISSLTPYIRSKEQATTVLSVLLQFNPNEDILHEVAFPFEIMDYHFRFLPTTPGPKSAATSELEVEFSSNDYKQDSSSINESGEFIDQFAYFKFLAKYESSKPDSCIRYMSNLSPECILACLLFYEESGLLEYHKSNMTITAGIVRLIGEKLLSIQDFDRSESTIFVSCRLLEILMPTMNALMGEELRKDSLDLISYFYQCAEKDILTSERATAKVWNLLLRFTKYNEEVFLVNADIVSTLLRRLPEFSNRMRISVCESLHHYIDSLDSQSQRLVFQKAIETFITPQSSVESCATYCLFLTNLSAELVMDTSVLICLMKYSRFPFFIPYLRRCIGIMALNKDFGDSKVYFKNLRLDILKYWWMEGFEFSEFPFTIFGYSDSKEFISDNSKQMTSILLALRCKPERIAKNRGFMNTIKEVKSTDSSNLIRESLPSIIALSYTSNGVRSEVFASLKKLLDIHYKEYVREKLPLIVLEVVQFTDVTSEILLRAAVRSAVSKQYLKSSEIINSDNQENVDPSSSVELISALIKIFWDGEAEEFWSLQTVYFLFRRIGIENTQRSSGKSRSILRRLQYVLSLSKIELSDLSLVKLTISICLPMIRSGIICETLPILNSIDFELCHSVPVDQSLPMIFEILAAMLSISEEESEPLKEICEKLDHLVDSESDYFGTSKIIVKSAIHSVRNQIFELDLVDVEAFLDDKTNHGLVSTSGGEIFRIISKLSANITIKSKEATTSQFASMCLKYQSDAQVDDRFRLWISEYLAEFHLSGLAYTSLEDIILFKEYSGLEKADFLGTYKTLNPFLDHLIKQLEFGSYEEGAFLENILGALIHKFTMKKRDVSKFIDFNQCYERFSPYILPLDFHSCTLLNGEKTDSLKATTSAEEFVNDFESIIQNLPFETWACQLLLSLFQEISSYTSIVPILVDCVFKIPRIAEETLPSLICFYACIAGETAIESILKLFQGYWKSFRKPFCQKSIELMKNIAIALRIGAMQNIEIFKKVYGSLDHKHLFIIVRESNSPKSSLLFFEDSLIRRDESLDWTAYRDSLAKLYSSINDEDSLSGIPGDVTLENSLNLRYEFVPSAEKLRYNSGFLDADFILNSSPSPSNLLQSLQNEGYIGASSLLNRQSDVNSMSEWSWKLNQWDLPADNTSNDRHDVTYSYFKQIKENRLESRDIYESSMLKLVSGMPELVSSSLCPRETILATENWLESLALIKSANVIFDSMPSAFSVEVSSFEKLTKWFEVAETRHFEDILWARRLAFSLHESKTLTNDQHISLMEITSELQSYCQQGEINEIVRYNNLLRRGEMLQKTISSCILLEKVVKRTEADDPHLYRELQRLSSFQTAHTLWLEGKTDVSVALLRSLTDQGDISLTMPTLNVSQTTINAQLAVWLAESRSDLGSNILERVVDPIKVDIDSVDNIRQRSQIYHLLAHFCESQFKSRVLKEQIMSLEARLKSRKDEVQEIKSHYGRSEVSVSERNAARIYYDELKSSIKSANNELVTLKELRMRFAHNAVSFYLKTLLLGEASDEDLDKFFSLFLELSGDEVLQSAIKGEVLNLPSYRPLTWCTQILSRVSKEVSSFQESIQSLIFKICHDHPFHSLYYLTSLLYHERLAKETSNASMISRVAAATYIRNKLHGSSSAYASEVLLPIERLCMESVSLAEIKSSKGRTFQLDKLRVGNFWLMELPRIPPPTLEIPVSNSGYSKVPTMVKIDPKVAIASSGISLPKVVTIFPLKW